MHRRDALIGLVALTACRTTTSAPSIGASGSSSSVEPVEPVGPVVASSAPPIASALEKPVDPAPYPQDEPKRLVANDELALHDWSLPGDAKISQRCVVLVPRHLAVGERVPLLVALHGLAETVDETMGAYAWVDKYGLAEGYAHLRAPDSISVASMKKMMTQERVDELHATLAERPFRGMVIACPYTPNIWKVSPDVEATLDALTNWIFDVLTPRLRAETPVRTERDFLGVDGVSLGGYASLGVGVRRAAELGAIGCVQAAISGDAAAWGKKIAAAFAKSGKRPLHLLTSTLDVFRKPVEALHAELLVRGVEHDFRIAIGPHDQPFLRGPGSVEMLLWHARALGG